MYACLSVYHCFAYVVVVCCPYFWVEDLLVRPYGQDRALPLAFHAATCTNSPFDMCREQIANKGHNLDLVYLVFLQAFHVHDLEILPFLDLQNLFLLFHASYKAAEGPFLPLG